MNNNKLIYYKFNDISKIFIFLVPLKSNYNEITLLFVVSRNTNAFM